MIENSLIKLSKNKNIVDDKICTYQNAVDKSNFKHKLTYKTDFKNRKRKETDQEKLFISIYHFANQ